ncbi:hypothetical protein IQ276_005085 [Desmonostoc muscorum LEGE 12446]|uniref:Uncharacterized protein n=1 Tax=Desmonostoc muscorum LEGE 12446 TaxID=1828758 RepID=A0A8J6ZPQ2_DESMC|nr:hypothetical protein [Desmonostoc muscorum]MCF2145844.1 hypothetical protein [Desmonostoc muscorum LEGE 12446]
MKKVLSWLGSCAKSTGKLLKGVVVQGSYMADTTAENTQLSIAANAALEEKRQEMRLAELQLGYLRHKESQDFQADQAKVSYERALEKAQLDNQYAMKLQEFVKSVDYAIHQEGIKFQKWRLQQEQGLQLELQNHRQAFEREMAAYQRQTAIKVAREQIEIQKIFQNWPLKILPTQLLESPPDDGYIPIKVFIAPPKFPKGFPSLEEDLVTALKDFLKNYNHQGRLVEFLDGAWENERFSGGASIKVLFGMLNSNPILVLEPEILTNYLNLNVAYWGLGQKRHFYEPIISKMPYRDILFDSAKERAKEWQKHIEKLLNSSAKNLEEIKKIYGQEIQRNFQLLQDEEELKKTDIDISQLGLKYTINEKDIHELYQVIITANCLISGLLIDTYYLNHYGLPPLLPKLLPDLLQDIPDNKIVVEVVQWVVEGYRSIYEVLQDERSHQIPELGLQLAKNLAFLPDNSLAKEQVNYSIQSWLGIHGISQLEAIEDTQLMKSVIDVADEDFLNMLSQCLASLGKENSLAEADALLSIWHNLKFQGDIKVDKKGPTLFWEIS